MQVIKPIATFLTLVFAGSVSAAPRPEPDLGAPGPAVLRAAAAGAWRLQVTTAGGGDNRLLSAAWDDDTTNHWIVRLVLLREQDETVVPVRAVRREDAYNPKIETVPSWNFGDRPVLLMRYQVGGAAALRVYDTADMKDAPACFGWEARSRALVHRSCEARQTSGSPHHNPGAGRPMADPAGRRTGPGNG